MANALNMVITTVCLALVIAPLPIMSTLMPTLNTKRLIESTGVISNPKRVFFRTSHWLSDDPVYGLHGTDQNAMSVLVDRIHASDIIVYFRDDNIASWEWNRLVRTVDDWKARGKKVWLMIAKTTLDETKGTPQSTQYVIDTFQGRIEGIVFNARTPVDPSIATDWLLLKRMQLETAGMKCAYYHGDGFAQHYGNSSTDVSAVYLSQNGLIPMAWLMNDNSWKPATFSIPHFWIDYDILAASQINGPTGQSYDEIFNKWYQANVIQKDYLKDNLGCEALVFMIYMNFSWPSADALNGMVAVASDWTRTT